MKNYILSKYLASSVLGLSIFLFVFASVSFAIQPVENISVQGKVKTSDGNTNAGGASVNVTCNSTTIPTTADSNGNYSVEFTPAECSEGATVNVTASLNGESGTDSEPASKNTNLGIMYLGAVAVPEFGLITGLVAAAGSGLAYLKMKRVI